MDRLIFKSKYNPKLHKGFYQLHMFRKSMSVYFYIIAALLSIFLAIQNTLSEEIDPNTIAFSWGFALLLTVALPVFTFGKINAIVRGATKRRKDSIEIIEITKAKITRILEGAEGKAVLGWENFDSVYETKDCIYMYIDKDRGLVLPKADIYEGNIEIFRKLAKNNLKPNKKGKSRYKMLYKESEE